MASPRRNLLLLAAFFAWGSGAPTSAETLMRCSVSEIAVSAEDLEAAERGCDVAVAADLRLRSLGLGIDQDVRIEITEDLDVGPGVCVALYNTGNRTLQILPERCLEDQPGRAKTFPEMPAETLFESLVLHEMAHAYAHQSAGDRRLSRIAFEYLAYAIQVDALSDEVRRRIVDNASVREPVKIGDINEAVLSLSPSRFAAMSWLHFHQEGGNADLVARVLGGSLAFNSLRE